MKSWVAIAVAVLTAGGAVVGAGLLGLRAQANAESAVGALVLAERASLAKAKLSVAPPVASAPAIAAPPVAHEPPALALTFRQTSTYNGAPVYVPEGCRSAYDVVMHFHGAHTLVKSEVQDANVRAVVAVFNAGNGAEKYAQAYQAPGTLRSLLRQIEMAVAPLCPGPESKPARVALLGFSAGYGAVEKLLARPEDRDRVDAALLADGLHAAFVDVWKRQLAPNALQPFREFGELAKQGQKLLAITHSSILTDGYASTTECSRHLLKALNVPCEEPLISGKSGGFSVEGFPGDDKAAHIRQFRQMDSTLLIKLRERWQR